VGVGRGLNDGLDLAYRTELMWLLTADQDSTVTATYLESLVRLAEDLLRGGVPVGAVAAKYVRDASGPMTYPTRPTQTGETRFEETDEVIQSGTLWHVPSLIRRGGFNSSLGMDAVDAEACLGLRELNRLIVVASGLEFHHRIGTARQVRLLGRSVMVTRHDPQRRLTMVLNRFALFPREFRRSPKHAFLTVRRALLNATLSSLPTGRSGIYPPEH
jgi:GT2 family glycosyltransferase